MSAASRAAVVATAALVALVATSLAPLAAAGGGVAMAAWPHPELLHGAAERIVSRALIPSPQNVHGEVLVARRGDATCVETVLCSPILGRGLATIRKREQERWPADMEGHDDSAAFLAALDTAEDRVRDEFLARRNVDDDRRKMLIEIVRGEHASFFALYAIDARRTGDRFEVLAARPIVVKDVSPAYADGSLRTQAGNAFHLQGTGLEDLLAGR